MDFVGNLTENNKKFDLIILNAGPKATRKRVDWNGKKLNMCRVVNLLANDYLLAQMKIHNLITTDAKIDEICNLMKNNLRMSKRRIAAAAKVSCGP